MPIAPALLAALQPQRIWDRCDALGRLSELPGGLTRVFLSAEQARANELVLGWMRKAGMAARLDAIGNCVGRYEGERPGLPCLMLGSHLDTVRDAGKYDGMLGVIAAIECVGALHANAVRLPFAIEVVGFGDEEGVRFGSTLLGSRAVAGTFDPALLDKQDANGVAMRDALRGFGLDPAKIAAEARRPRDVLAYAELHIEQGPVLEAEGLATGVVTAINGGNRFSIELTGMAGHAGTVPMRLRRDALAAAADVVLAVERIATEHAGHRRHRRAHRSIAGCDERDSGQGSLLARRARAHGRTAPRGGRGHAHRLRDHRAAAQYRRGDHTAVGGEDRACATRRCSANSPRPSRKEEGGCATCRPVPDTTAWRWSTSRRSA